MSDIDTNRIRWACRRGMWELDLILEGFLDECLADCNQQEHDAFVNLLSCQDQEIFAWLMGREQPKSPELQMIVSKIRAVSHEEN